MSTAPAFGEETTGQAGGEDADDDGCDGDDRCDEEMGSDDRSVCPDAEADHPGTSPNTAPTTSAVDQPDLRRTAAPFTRKD